jgi:DNA polymerase
VRAAEEATPVVLGVTAVLALNGNLLPVGANRGETEFDGRCGFITVHPASPLRPRSGKDRRDAFRKFVSDLRSASDLVGTGARAVPESIRETAR